MGQSASVHKFPVHKRGRNGLDSVELPDHVPGRSVPNRSGRTRWSAWGGLAVGPIRLLSHLSSRSFALQPGPLSLLRPWSPTGSVPQAYVNPGLAFWQVRVSLGRDLATHRQVIPNQLNSPWATRKGVRQAARLQRECRGTLPTPPRS